MPTEAESRLAEHLLECSDRNRLIADSQRLPGLAMNAAERIQQTVRERRVGRGEQVIGYKIGLTNRRAWPQLGISAPIWGPLYARQTERLETSRVRIESTRYCQPRLEPEIVLGLAQTPAGDDPAALAEAVGWVAHGIEMVQSIYPGWRCTVPESVAAQAMHGSMHIGPGIPAGDAGTLPERLAGVRLALERCDSPGESWVLVGEGTGSDVLDGPIAALGHLVRCLRERGQRLAAGDIISTGTLVDPQTVVSGQRWRTRLQGMPGLEGFVVDIA